MRLVWEKHNLPAYTELRSLYKTCWMNANWLKRHEHQRLVKKRLLWSSLQRFSCGGFIYFTTLIVKNGDLRPETNTSVLLNCLCQFWPAGIIGTVSNAQCQIPFNIVLSISPLGVMPLCKNVAPISRPITGVITSVFPPWHPIHLLQSLIGSFDWLHVFRIVEK